MPAYKNLRKNQQTKTLANANGAEYEDLLAQRRAIPKKATP